MPREVARAAVLEHLAAFNAHDTARVLAGFATDAVWTTGADRFDGLTALARGQVRQAKVYREGSADL